VAVGAADPAPGCTARLTDGSWVRVRTTTRADGDLQIDRPEPDLTTRRRTVVERPWAWLRQVHGAEVVTVTAGGVVGVCGTEADGLVTADPGIVLAVHTADCAPVALWSPEGVIAAVHAGWRGIDAGVIDAAVASMRALGATTIDGWLGPCIHAECYAFGADDLARLSHRLGDAVVGRTAAGSPALDVPAAVATAAARAGVSSLIDDQPCTGCDGGSWFSHRVRGDEGRQATVVWREVS
jgi:YfiH family protein